MNYITEINSFWYSATMNPLSTGQVALWFALMNICNKENWTEWFQAPNQVLSILTGMSRSGILKARNELKQRGYIEFKERGTKYTLYKVNMLNSKQDSKQDSVQNSMQNGTQNGTQNSNTLFKHKLKTKTKADITPDICELHNQVINYLNKKTGSNFKTTTPNTKRHIDARVGDGYVFADFCVVIDKKVNEWGKLIPGQKDMRQYLRPDTLFGTKFESYLNQKEVKEISANRFNNFEQNDTDYDALEKELLSY